MDDKEVKKIVDSSCYSMLVGVVAMIDAGNTIEDIREGIIDTLKQMGDDVPFSIKAAAQKMTGVYV